MNNFVFQTIPKIIFGNKSLNHVIEELVKLKINSVFFVCDPAVRKMQIFEQLTLEIKNRKIRTEYYSEIKSDPDYENVDEA
ncbi:MAG TPA: iron-containing alcohol dehydrogenase, partial [Bacteroidales bacterium]|nr:iron-containing alcohol dehydrogenase [Bacteroidales bacterium]